MKIKIKSLDNFKQNYEKLFELEKIINLEEKKYKIIKFQGKFRESKLCLEIFLYLLKNCYNCIYIKFYRCYNQYRNKN